MRLSQSGNQSKVTTNNHPLYQEITDTSSLELIREILKANKKAVESGQSEAKLGGNSGIMLHFKSPQLAKRLELFKKFSEPFVIPGRTDLGPLIFYGGLGATGYSWQATAMKLFARSGIHCEVHSMAGHTGNWTDLRDTNEEAWIRDIEAKVSRFEKPPVFFAYSTSLLAAFELERRKPGTFQAIVGVGGPFLLSNRKLEKYLDVGRRVERISRILSGGYYSPLVHGSVPMESFDNAPSTKASRKSPVVSYLPLPTTLSLRRLQIMAKDAAKELHCPLFYAQGLHDRAIDGSVPDFLLSQVPANFKCFRIYENSGHGPQLGVDKKKFLKDVSLFLNLLLQEKNPFTPELPNFRKPDVRMALQQLKQALIGAVVDHKATQDRERTPS